MYACATISVYVFIVDRYLGHFLFGAVTKSDYKNLFWASLVLQWLRIRLPMQGTRVRALVWEDPTCRGAAGPVSHNY